METEELELTKEAIVLNALEKFSDCSIENLETVTGIFKLHLYKILKVLQADNRVVVNKGGTPTTYSLTNKKTETAAKAKTDPTKEVDNSEVGSSTSKSVGVMVKTNVNKKTAKVSEDEAELLKTGSRDTSKLKFNGELYGKGRLVLAVVKKYVEDNPRTTFSKLKEVFPDELQPRYGVVEEFSKAKKISADRDRFFLKAEDLIKVGDKKIAVCNQFGSHNLPLKHFKSLGFVIK